MADRRGRDADFTGVSPDSNASPPVASPVSPERTSQANAAAGYVSNPQRYSLPAQTEQARAAYVINPQAPGDGPGLGIQQDASSPSAAAIGGADRRLRVRIVSNTSPGTPTAGAMLSPTPEEGTYSTANTYFDPGASAYGLDGDDDAPRRYQRAPSYKPAANPGLTPSISRSVGAESIRSTQSRRSKYDNDFHPDKCPTARDFTQGRLNWLALSLLLLAIFSTIFSCVYLVIGIRAPRWGRAIRTNGPLSPSGANILTQLFAKLIEMSFVAVFVAFMGQVISRRAISSGSRGITLAELGMRNWIMQPGSILTHYETVRFAALTVLGVIALTVAILATLYTTAATALVTPVLKFGNWENRYMYGVVKTTFANAQYQEANCQMPIQPNGWDPDYTPELVGQTCMTINYAAQSFGTYQQYMGTWYDLMKNGNGTTQQQYRPAPVALFLQNTTVNGTWINIIDTAAVSKENNRVINNVTLAMPHIGVFQAAHDPLSNILQPDELDGLGVYQIRAAVPSPYINVLCANVNEDEIAPLVYSASVNSTLVPSDLPLGYVAKFNWTALYATTTPVDDIFGWTPENIQNRPVFYKFPIAKNTILNNTGGWGQDSEYLLGNGVASMTTTADKQYFLCRMRAGLTPYCSTYYTAQSIGGQMQAHCNDSNEDMTYIKGNSSRATTISLDWFDTAETAFNALSLNNGIIDGNASNAFLLSELMLQKLELNQALPSPAEALAVLGSASLLMSVQDSPFVEFWNYSNSEIGGEHQAFNASIRAQQYASGGTSGYQRSFAIVLLAVFLCNVLVLVYFLVYGEFVTDFSEPLNLFSLAINSPPSQFMRGSCGAGPEGDQYTLKWGVEMEHEHLFIADRQTATSPYGASQVLLDNAGPAGGEGADAGGGRASRGSGLAEGRQSWIDLFSNRPKWTRLSSSDVAGGGAAAARTTTPTVPPSRAGAASVKSGAAEAEVIEMGPLDESATAYVSPTRGGEQQHNSYADRPEVEAAEQDKRQSQVMRSFSVMARMRSWF